MDEDLAYQKGIRGAIKAGDGATAKALIDADPRQLHTMTWAGTWMHVAAARGQMELVEWLVRRGADAGLAHYVFPWKSRFFESVAWFLLMNQAKIAWETRK